MGDLVCAHVIISGRVQGVFFRAETRDAAERIGAIGGWVRNRRDGTVEAVFEGTNDKVADMLDWCREGPPQAMVSDVAVDWPPPTGEFTDFNVTY